MDKQLEELIQKSREIVNAMTSAEKSEMLRKQAEGCSEAQWAKDFAEGRCVRD